MINLEKYKGIGQFGPAYKIMIENDVHALNSTDRIIMKNMIRLCPETVKYLYSAYTPIKVQYQKNSRPILEAYFQKSIGNSKIEEDKIRAITDFCRKLSKKEKNHKLNDLIFGGTEEEIIQRGSSWCTDLARVGCILSQIAGFPSRLVILTDVNTAYNAHDIIEVYRKKKWGAVDVTDGIVYLNKQAKPLSTWDLRSNSNFIQYNVKKDFRNKKICQFQNAAISNYFVKDFKKYNYITSKINNYYRSILEMSLRGWPGGITWLHAEDRRI